jgi:heavy metal translocating P-type ATPase
MSACCCHAAKLAVACAYCAEALPADAVSGDCRANGQPAPRYCSYACRELGESGHHASPVPTIASRGWFRVGLGAAIAAQSMALGLALNLAPPDSTARPWLHGALILSALGVFTLLGRPLLRETFNVLRERRLAFEWLFLAGIVGAFGASLQSTVTGIGAVYYEVVAVLVTIYTLGQTLGARARDRVLAESRKLHDEFDTCRVLRPGGETESIPAARLQTGDRVLVRAGEAIPCDGLIEHGEAFVRETPLTGEPFPVPRRVGDAVFAGAHSEDGELLLRATVSGTERRLDRLLALAQTARETPSRWQREADRVTKWFLPAVAAIAAATFAFWTARAGWHTGLFNALAVLLVACPCAMGLATPLAIWNALASLAARGLVVRSADVLDRLARVTQVAFDKTGTLSEKQLSLVDFVAADAHFDRTTLLAALRSAEGKIAHPVARAFDLLPEHPADLTITSAKSIPAFGIEATVTSRAGTAWSLRAGRRELMTDFRAESSLRDQLRCEPADQLLYVEANGRLVGLAAIRERARTTLPETLTALESLGLHATVLTGDRPERAHALGLDQVAGNLTPEAKADAVRSLRERGPVVFIGDGVNDAPAMRAADVGVALQHGAGLTTAVAEATLFGGDLRLIPDAIRLAHHTRRVIRSNLLFAAAYNAVGVTLAATGLLHPIAAALLMLGSSLTVSWRAVRMTAPGSHIDPE